MPACREDCLRRSGFRDSPPDGAQIPKENSAMLREARVFTATDSAAR
jgi:hypothetical protein